ncbi:MAG: biosynthetic arginine decarboxylase [Ignavibacteria bacterium]|nr:biosynthetic arginine decarboxylase [Ignavibacteria bacterium]MBL7993250.1 biosynthetic arginine decarboxylase [Candidatus Kapabacteria bacterium]
MRAWSTDDSYELYNMNGWGAGYFGINEKGNITVSPQRTEGPAVDLKELVDDLILKDLALPILVRFSDIIGDRIGQISQCFKTAAQEYGFEGRYFGVYPIKVNQQKHVVEEIVRYGREFNIGLEAGSKPELQAVLAIMDNPESIIICNGYKDEEFIELALLAQKMGKEIFLVVEKLNELKLIKTVAERNNVRPNIGIRIKLTNSGSGKWEESGGDQSKFGLNASELLEAIDFARENNLLECVSMIHFHLGSQITNIRRIKAGLREVSHFYVQLRSLGCNIQYVDIGGGLGVDYDGSASMASNSMNYSMQEYADDAVYTLCEACKKYSLPHPNLITESGRALTAHHSVLVLNVLEATSLPNWDDEKDKVAAEDHQIVQDMFSIYKNLAPRNLGENWHDAQQLKEEALNLFSLGILDLPTRAKSEKLFWTIARAVQKIAAKMKNAPDEFEQLQKVLADKYFCNFSLFQSLPDAWAIDQIFPITPVHRLTERPTQEATLQDVTCDSDGKIEKYIGMYDYPSYLPVHPLKKDEPYYLAVFLVGAYQEILGDLHNLFGDTNAVHITLNKKGEFEVAQIIEGETVADVLEYVQFNPKELVRTMEKWVSTSVKESKITLAQGKEFLAMYRSGLYGYTYLEE